MDKDSRESKGRGTLLHVIKQEPNAWVSSLKESTKPALKPSNRLIATSPRLEGSTWMDSHPLVEVAHMLHQICSTIVDGER